MSRIRSLKKPSKPYLGEFDNKNAPIDVGWVERAGPKHYQLKEERWWLHTSFIAEVPSETQRFSGLVAWRRGYKVGFHSVFDSIYRILCLRCVWVLTVDFSISLNPTYGTKLTAMPHRFVQSNLRRTLN